MAASSLTLSRHDSSSYVSMHLAALMKKSLEMLRSHTPPDAACVADVRTKAYKITAGPSSTAQTDEANKNTCIIVYAPVVLKLSGNHATWLPSTSALGGRCFR